MRNLPSVERLRELLEYKPETGDLVWRGNRGSARKGSVVGGSCKGSYALVRVDGHALKAHRVVWAMCKGQWPELGIDHRNRDSRDNRLENLREFTQAQNLRNTSGWADKPTKLPLGVSLDVRYKNPYFAQICVRGRKQVLGRYATVNEASAAYMAAKQKFHPEFYTEDARRA